MNFRSLTISLFVILLSWTSTSTISLAQENNQTKTYLKTVKAIIDTAMLDGKAFSMLAELCNDIGPRLSGSPQAAAAVEWSRQVMVDYGLDNVHLQPVLVPHWIRGNIEEAAIINSPTLGTAPLTISALGSSIGTPEMGVVAEVIEVKSLEEVKQLGKKAKGKIVFYNRPIDPRTMNTFAGYGGAVDQRTRGAVEAAKVGAVAVLVRSVTTRLDKVPHTGVMHYEENVSKIPAAAISTVDANLLSNVLKNDEKVSVRIALNCLQKPDIISYNVIGEIKGHEKPDEVVVLGGHLDSWDVGHGAHDDGAGCVQAIEALRLIKILDLKPKRTVRVVLFMCEEFGLRGGPAYADSVENSGATHIAAIESDRGGLTPRGFSINTDSTTFDKIKRCAPLFEAIDTNHFIKGGGGPDISPLRKLSVTTIGLLVDYHRYFDYHHSDNDVLETVNERELELGAVAMAILGYWLAMEGI